MFKEKEKKKRKTASNCRLWLSVLDILWCFPSCTVLISFSLTRYLKHYIWCSPLVNPKIEVYINVFSLKRVSSKVQCINKQWALFKYHAFLKRCKDFKDAECNYTMFFYIWPSLSRLSSFSDEKQLLSTQ